MNEVIYNHFLQIVKDSAADQKEWMNEINHQEIDDMVKEMESVSSLKEMFKFLGPNGTFGWEDSDILNELSKIL
jgi:hypothetical protein